MSTAHYKVQVGDLIFWMHKSIVVGIWLVTESGGIPLFVASTLPTDSVYASLGYIGVFLRDVPTRTYSVLEYRDFYVASLSYEDSLQIYPKASTKLIDSLIDRAENDHGQTKR
jgi:hypothetical protein